MPTNPLFPGNTERATDTQATEDIVEIVEPDEIEKQLQDSIQKYGEDKPRRQRIRATIIHD